MVGAVLADAARLASEFVVAEVYPGDGAHRVLDELRALVKRCPTFVVSEQTTISTTTTPSPLPRLATAAFAKFNA